MNPMRFQKVREALGELEELPEYQALWDDADSNAQRFRQGVDWVGMRCMQLKPEAPTDREIGDQLVALQGLCVGRLARFQRFILVARDALRAP